MKSSLGKLCVAGIATLAILAPTAALAASNRRFVVNNTNGSLTIQQVWTAASGTSDSWEETTMDHPIKPNTKSTFNFGDGNVCFYDIKLKFSDGYEQQFENVNVCNGDSVRAT